MEDKKERGLEYCLYLTYRGDLNSRMHRLMDGKVDIFKITKIEAPG